LDLGQKRIGVALSDPLGLTAQGLAVISYNRDEEALERIAALCREYAVEQIVAGLPLNMNGSRGPAVREVERFAALLKKRTGLPLTLIDERLTSQAAERALIEGKMRRQKRKAVRNRLAAVLILQSYLAALPKTE
jgi:putative Holliday junction resolvase